MNSVFSRDKTQLYKPRTAGYERGTAPGLGVASITLVFVILCLTIFAALTLQTANAEYNLALRSLEAVYAYYAIDSIGVKFVSELREAAKSGAESLVYAAEAKGAAAELSGVTVLITRDIGIEGSQSLRISLEFTGERVRVTEWKVVYTGNWVADNNQKLWTGN